MEKGRILNRELFLDRLNVEVKRARRYQNFFSILRVRLSRLPGYQSANSAGLQKCHLTLSNLLMEEVRESDILGHIENDQLAILAPYAELSSLEFFRARLEEILKCYEFNNKGYEVQIDPLCFPLDGTDAADLIGRLQEWRSPSSA
jgi:GGDEF domain-containing protein